MLHFSAIYACMPLANAFFAFRQSNGFGKAIVLILVVGSIFIWSIMAAKWNELKHAKEDSDRLMTDFRKEKHPVSLYLKKQRFDDSPLYVVYEGVCKELRLVLEVSGANPDDLFMGGIGNPGKKLSKHFVSAVRNVSERTVADQALLLEDRMGFIATAASTAPFLGLLGTVWGVMDAFGGMGVKGAAMLSTVAPGISGALVTTVVGLLVALPSAVGYNILSDRIRKLTVQMDNFSQELISAVECHYL